MMTKWKSLLALGAFFVLGVTLSACGGGIAGNAVADMAGNPITTSTFNHWMYVAAKGQASQSPGAPVIVPSDPPEFKGCIAQVRKQIPTLAKTSDKQVKTDCSRLFTSLSGQVMDFLIKAYWYQADATRQNIKVSDADVQKAFTTAKQGQFPTDAAFQTFLTTSGQTLQDILFRVRINQIFRKLLTKHSTAVTPAQIQAYYSSHLSQFGTPETRNLRIILAKTRSQALAAKAALAGGQSWKAVAKKYSTDPSKSKGGLLVGVAKGQEDQALDTAAFAARANKLLGPIKAQLASGFYVFEVTKITKATQQSLVQATPLIQQTLTSQSQTSAQSVIDKQARKDWLQKTQCRAGYSMADCNGYKPPSTPTTTAPTPAPATPPPSTTT